MIFEKARTIKRILIVEDEPLVAFDNEHMLMVAGYEILATVDSYDDVVEILDRTHPGEGDWKPDLILADIWLDGERSGMDVARLARQRDIPLLFITGNCPDGVENLAIGCLAKPYDRKALLASVKAIDRLVAGRSPRRVPTGLTLFPAYQTVSAVAPDA